MSIWRPFVVNAFASSGRHLPLYASPVSLFCACCLLSACERIVGAGSGLIVLLTRITKAPGLMLLMTFRKPSSIMIQQRHYSQSFHNEVKN